MLYRFFLSKKGFTVIELLIVFAVIAILAAIAVPLYRIEEDKHEKNDCAMQCQMISTQLKELMGGMVDNGQKQDKIDFSKLASVVTVRTDQSNGNQKCIAFNEANKGRITIGLLRGGYRNLTTYPNYDDGCAAGCYLKKQALSGKLFYTLLAASELPVCPYDGAATYYLYEDGSVRCSTCDSLTIA